MVREIVVYPDKRLKLISKEVTKFDGTLHTLLDDMYDTMCAKNGIGLAAIQVGEDKRVLIINIPLENIPEGEDEQPKENSLEMINPIIIKKEGLTKFQEGCLSVPGIYEEIERAKYVKVEYFDRFGKKHTIEDDDFLAIAMQHEMDHLDGKIFVEKLSFIKRKKFEKEWKKRKKVL
ncbi:MAG: peptide deformylase [Sulfurovum sp.]|nr:peptide deformylase [Sulfurovum sp.]MCB4746350.1 peptide deformylase [Sulfurovum sp.]MCB4747152.1 peptide deformylase [Sulfurovum sp.]MCB4748842.1 peptide deformylase [Sulfurovum sp.]MCB4749935.1 peptide deformylase [Sulfurovum sp.]